MSTDALTIDAVQEAPVSAGDWKIGTETLGQLLAKSGDGCVSAMALGKELTRRGIANPRRVAIMMKFFDFDAPSEESRPTPNFRWRHHGRSFYSEEGFRRIATETANQAEIAAKEELSPVEPEALEVADEDAEDAPIRRSNRQEEARLVRYVVEALGDIYNSEHGPDDRDLAYDVHNERAGGDFENVDVIGLHWRSRDVVDLVAVEVKLAFTARLIQQANNYRRFADRVWIALPVHAPVGQAAAELREINSRLFEYLVSTGIGVLACHRRRGRTYEVFPVQWPQRCHPDPIERHEFIERHYGTFEIAGAVAPRSRGSFPKLR